MPVDPNLFNTLKAAEKKMLTDATNWAQLVGAVTMYAKTLNDFDHKLHNEKDAVKVKAMETHCKAEFAKMKTYWAKWTQTWTAADKSMTFTRAVSLNVGKAAKAANDKVAWDWVGKTTKNVTITEAGLKQGKTAVAKYATDYNNFLKNKHFV